VTSGAWGANAPLTGRVIERLGAVVDAWDFGYDAFHAEHLPMEAFVAAVSAAVDCGGLVAVRLCDDHTLRSIEIRDRLDAQLPDGIGLIVQPTFALGRGAGLGEAVTRSGGAALPCISTGAFVREDGSVGPCCAALGYSRRGDHPFEYGPIGEVDLLTAWRRWRDDPLLRLMRLTGMTFPLRWLEEEGMLPADAGDAGHVCGTCEKLWDSDGKAGDYLRNRARNPDVVAMLDRLEETVFGGVWQETRECDAA
jgi:hypothetical protein